MDRLYVDTPHPAMPGCFFAAKGEAIKAAGKMRAGIDSHLNLSD
jgi:hypothetical protein